MTINTTAVVSRQVQTRLTATLFAMSSLFAAAQIAAFTLISIVSTDLAGTETVAGVPVTLSLIGRAAAAYPIGWLMGRAGRRAGLTLGLVLAMAGNLLGVVAILSGSFWLFALGVGLTGVGRGSADLGRFAAADVYEPDRRAKVIGFIVFAGTIGAVAGPLLVAPATGWAEGAGLPGETGPYLLGALLCAVGAGLLFLLLRPDPNEIVQAREATRRDDSQESTRRPLLELLAVPPVALGIASMAIGQLVMTMLMVITPLHMNHLGHETADISLVIMSHTLGMYGLSALTGWLIDRTGPPTMVISGGLVLIVSSILTPLAGSLFGLAFALFLLGLGWNFCFVAGSALLTGGLSIEESGRAQGTGDAIASAAAGVGSLGSGFLFAGGEMGLVAGVGLALSVFLGAAVLFLNRQKRPAPQV